MDKQIAQSASDANISKWSIEAFDVLGVIKPAGPGRPKIDSLSKRIEHTSLKIDALEDDIGKLCNEADQHGFRSVCCLPRDVALCKRNLQNHQVLVVTVLNFPLAGDLFESTEKACKAAVDAGADELDMVVDVRSLRSGELIRVYDDIVRIVHAGNPIPIKVILETGCLTPRQIVEGSTAAWAAGASYVKTSTGFGPRGASIEDIHLMRLTVGESLGVKASGGIREAEFARKLVEAGADLLGTSSGTALY